jgi:hypothetical protein
MIDTILALVQQNPIETIIGVFVVFPIVMFVLSLRKAGYEHTGRYR